MKTLFLTQRIPYPPNKGEKIRSFHQIRFLLEHGHEIYLCCPHENDSDLESLERFTREYRITAKTVRLTGKWLRYLSGLVRRQPLSVSNFYSRELQASLDRLLDEQPIRNIVCSSSSMAEYVFNSPAIDRRDDRPCLVMDFMDLDSDKWKQYAQASSFPMNRVYGREALLLSAYERRISEVFDACLFISRAEVELFAASFQPARQPIAIGNGIDTQYFVPADRPTANRQPVFLFTGVMDYKPNVDAVVWFATEVWPTIRARYDDARFIVAGMNPVAPVRKLAQLRGVEITGFVEDILPYYHRADIFVAPLRIARGVQNKILQAFACGLPVVATAMGAEGIDCRDGEQILLADSPDEFFERIVSLLEDREQYESVRRNALALVKTRYSWNGRLSPLLDMLKQCRRPSGNPD